MKRKPRKILVSCGACEFMNHKKKTTELHILIAGNPKISIYNPVLDERISFEKLSLNLTKTEALILKRGIEKQLKSDYKK